MDINHLHLHVKDVEKSKKFYCEFFEFKQGPKHGKIDFLNNQDGFNLALAPDTNIPEFPTWFHFGMKMKSSSDVKDLFDRMATSGVEFYQEFSEEDQMAWFKVRDPDGYKIEVYWE
jgi:predicted lactoylglutathione lyase